MERRVVITGMAGITPMGDTLEAIFSGLKGCKNYVKYMKDWDQYEGLRTKLGSPVDYFTQPEHYNRKQVRSMGRVAIMSTYATEMALKDSGLFGSKEVEDGSTGIAYGSSSGSIDAITDFYSMLKTHVLSTVTSSTYIKMMSHTCAVNASVFFKITGRLIPTGTACTSGSLAIGYAYETIKSGAQNIMVAGGAEELSATQAAVFDTLFATSTKNDTPEKTPRPYDIDRDGLVIGEGAATLILEDYEHAKARGAKIYAEVIGFGTNTDGTHITQPNMETMAIAMELALKSAKLSPSEINYISGHGTATDHGDIAETQAALKVFKRPVSISSQKSYIGHTLGACGAIEAITSILMMNNDWYAPTLNLENIDPKCAELDYIRDRGKVMSNQYVMSNNFAFGGINSSLIFKRM